MIRLAIHCVVMGSLSIGCRRPTEEPTQATSQPLQLDWYPGGNLRMQEIYYDGKLYTPSGDVVIRGRDDINLAHHTPIAFLKLDRLDTEHWSSGDATARALRRESMRGPLVRLS